MSEAPRFSDEELERYLAMSDEERLPYVRSMSPNDRSWLGHDLTERERRLAIRARHPAYSDEEVRGVLFRQLYGDDLFRKVWPKAPLLDL